MDLEKTLNVLKNKEDYIVPNSDMSEAIETAARFIEDYINYKHEKLDGDVVLYIPEHDKEDRKMARFKVGDKVKVRTDLKYYEEYGSVEFTPGMEKFKGKILTIKEFDKYYQNYRVEENAYLWNEDMFEPVHKRKFEFVSRLKDNCGNIVNDLKLPERSTAKSAGYDFFNPEKIEIPPYKLGDKPTLVPTGVKVNMPNDEFLMLVNRSSNPKKKNLVIPNSLGIIDADYYNNADNEGEMMFAFYNVGTESVILEAGDKIGQGIFMKYGITDDDNGKGERTGGWGSTGK